MAHAVTVLHTPGLQTGGSVYAGEKAERVATQTPRVAFLSQLTQRQRKPQLGQRYMTMPKT